MILNGFLENNQITYINTDLLDEPVKFVDLRKLSIKIFDYYGKIIYGGVLQDYAEEIQCMTKPVRDIVEPLLRSEDWEITSEEEIEYICTKLGLTIYDGKYVRKKDLDIFLRLQDMTFRDLNISFNIKSNKQHKLQLVFEYKNLN